MASEEVAEPLLPDEARDKDAIPLDDLETPSSPLQMNIPPATPSKADQIGLWLAGGGMAIIILYTWTVIFTSNPAKLKWFALHPSFQVLALGFFVWGIVTLQPTSLSQPRAKAQAFSRHQSIMLAMGFPIIVAGTSAVIWNRTIHPGHHKGHFTTWHGRIGLISFIWMFIQIVIGAGSVWFKGRLFGSNPKAVYKYHRLSGYLLLSLWLFMLHSGGAWSHFAEEHESLIMRIVVFTIGPLAVLFGLWSRARLSKMKW